jgi:hypothetical protein
MTYTSKRKAKELAANFLAKKIRSRVPDKYKEDTDLSRKLNYGASEAKSNIKKGLKKLEPIERLNIFKKY